MGDVLILHSSSHAHTAVFLCACAHGNLTMKSWGLEMAVNKCLWELGIHCRWLDCHSPQQHDIQVFEITQLSASSTFVTVAVLSTNVLCECRNA